MRRFPYWFLSLCGVLGHAGCAAVGVEGPRFDLDAGPTGPTDPDGSTQADASLPIQDALPTLRITSPAAGASVAGRVRIEGESRDDRGVASVFVRVGSNVPLLANTDDNFAHWWVESPVPNGMFELEALARDSKGQRSNPERISLIGPSTASDEASPTVEVLSPQDGSTPEQILALVRGTAADDRAVVSMEVLRNGEPLTERAIETDDFFANWSRLVPLLPGELNELVFIARDALGQEGRATLTLNGRAEVDREAPDLTVTAPLDNAVLDGSELEVTGSADDEVGVREVKMRIGTRPVPGGDLVWGAYVQADTDDGFTMFAQNLAIPSGAFVLEVRAIDLSGLATSVTRNLTNAFVSDWTNEVDIPLRLRAETGAPTLRFELDKQGVNEVIVPSVQRDMQVLELEPTALLTDALEQIKNSCGELWKQDNTDPRHDCTGAGYGDGDTWRQSPEYSLVRLLTMTPANVVVDGTSVAELKTLANLLNIGGGFQQILADTLGIPKTREIVSTPAVAYALKENWLASHPAVDESDPKLPITLYDAMQDLSSLTERFGPAGSHPGILDPSEPPYSQILGPDFKMVLEAASNLRWVDGVDLSGDGLRAQKDYIALVQGDDVLEFDFLDPQKFDVQGLVEEPTVNLRMRLLENGAFIRSCTGSSTATRTLCKTNLPTREPPLAGYVWSTPRWELERIFAASARRDYGARANYRRSYLLGAAVITVGYGSDPAGWSTFDTTFNLGNPPPDQYIWELILEVAQVALHRVGGTTIPEGEANVAFTLRNVNVGLTADEIRAAMRPELQAQRQTLSDKLLGDYAKNNGAVDFYYKRGADNQPYLFFAAPSDPRPTQAYTYDKPGFFADPELTEKLSSAAAGTSGDSVHEKLELEPGETTVYIRDEEQNTHRLRFVVGDDPTEIRVFVSRQVK